MTLYLPLSLSLYIERERIVRYVLSIINICAVCAWLQEKYAPFVSKNDILPLFKKKKPNPKFEPGHMNLDTHVSRF